MTMYVAYCDKCCQYGPGTQDPNDSDAQRWCDEHNLSEGEHEAWIRETSSI